MEAARSIYAGVVNPRSGERIFPGPAPAGEQQWGAYAPGVFPIAANYWRDLVMRDATWTPAQLDLDKDLALARSLDTAGIDSTDPNLSAFVARRGKLLLWHGWTDGLIPAQNTIDYYEKVLATIGAERVKDSVRLFMAPGVDHCSGGEGPFQIDALEAIDAWVESGKAPEQLVASRPLAGGARRTRPLCPYPQVARYRGQGSTDEASNFACEPPRAEIMVPWTHIETKHRQTGANGRKCSRRGGVSVSILNVQRLRCSSLVAAIFVASVAALPHVRAQDTLVPSGRLVFRSSYLEFRPEGTFVVHTVLEGLREVRATRDVEIRVQCHRAVWPRGHRGRRDVAGDEGSDRRLRGRRPISIRGERHTTSPLGARRRLRSTPDVPRQDALGAARRAESRAAANRDANDVRRRCAAASGR